MYKKDDLLRSVAIVCIIALLSALAPLSDFDQDGLFDSLVTEGSVLLPVLLSLTGFVFLIKFFTACIAPLRLFPSPLVPPPISFN